MSIEHSFGGNPEKQLNFSERKPTSEEAIFFDALYQETASIKPANWNEYQATYPISKIDKDRASIRETQTQFETYSGEGSEAVTRLITAGVDQHNWLKPSNSDWDTYVDIANRFDDVFRGTDLIVVLHNKKTNEEIPIAIDTTTSEKYLPNKIAKTNQDIKHGNLRNLEYYISPVTDKVVGRKEAVAIVASYPRALLTELALQYKHIGEKIFSDPTINLEHWLRAEIIRQIESQLQVIKTEAHNHRDATRMTNLLLQTHELLQPTSPAFNKKEATD